MADYQLSQLLNWVRRAGADRLIATTDALVSDGTNVVTLSNDGNVLISTVLVDGTAADPSTYSLIGNQIVFTEPQILDSNITAVYTYSTYTDDDLWGFMEDATRIVQSDLKNVKWTLTSADETVDPITPPFLTDDPDHPVIFHDRKDPTVPDHTIEKLIVLKTAMNLWEDRASTAAGDAIMIKDGDTTIDTGKTANANEKTMERITTAYAAALETALSDRFHGDTSNLTGMVYGPAPYQTPDRSVISFLY